ncbi:MAG TPA: DUF1444 family protein [Urbifossiella sp.]|nr:DUF1444 family protein [Urbifossiella sp.]
MAYVVDTGEQFEIVQERHLDEENCSEDELHAAGLSNLACQAEGSLQVATHPCGEMFAVLMGGNFEASLILLEDVWQHRFRQFVSGDYVVAIPARDLLAFCDASSIAGLRELSAVREKARTTGADHPISDRLFRRMGSSWQVFDAYSRGGRVK